MENNLNTQDNADYSNTLDLNHNELIQQAVTHRKKEKAALIVIRWYMASVVIFGVAILYCLYRQDTEGGVITAICMILICCLGLVFNLPEVARAHGRAASDLFNLASHISQKTTEDGRENWSSILINIKSNV
ncbi:hypothetical protein [Chromobacterium haemolyticum]|uniref:hypothetical protein n=1 Tax=Chromobacterium haemolyticum TaxID=394935 RepID=UPI0011300638|nr:hypothetical protein [Chromobacterium haemolyticum]